MRRRTTSRNNEKRTTRYRLDDKCISCCIMSGMLDTARYTYECRETAVIQSPYYSKAEKQCFKHVSFGSEQFAGHGATTACVLLLHCGVC